MNKKFTYPVIIVLFLTAIAFIFIRYRTKGNSPVFYELLQRKGALASAPEWAEERTTMERLSRSVRENPDDVKSALSLATLFIREARVTGNYSYYDMAAMNQVDHVLQKDPKNFEALTYKALIYLSQHHFAEGLQVAESARKINPYNSFIYGILTDGNVEMGHYQQAIDAADKMINIRPDLRSYSRVSYLREIHGDYPGAIEAMKMAVDAGVTGDDATEWARMQLGHLYENTGDLTHAEMQYRISVNARPGFAPAIAGLGHIAEAKKEYAKAISYYLQADTLMNDYSFKEELADLYALTGDPKKADKIYKEVIREMNKEAGSALEDPAAGHYVDRELAYAYLKINEQEKALQHALAEYNRRPENIDANETVAWVYYKMKEYNKALPYISKSLATNSRNPVLLCHAGLIYAKAENQAKASSLLQEALKNDPAISASLKEEALETLHTL